MTKKQKTQLKRDIKNLLERSYEDDGNSYEIEFRCMLEDIIYNWTELTEPHKIKRQHETSKGIH